MAAQPAGIAGREPLRPAAVRLSKPVRLAAAAALLAVGSCGKMADLRPAEGQPMPVKPMMARATPTPNELLTPPAYANPDRVDELLRKSTPRMTDRFDLPPPSGQAPAVPVQELDEDMTNNAGPASPQ